MLPIFKGVTTHFLHCHNSDLNFDAHEQKFTENDVISYVKQIFEGKSIHGRNVDFKNANCILLLG